MTNKKKTKYTSSKSPKPNDEEKVREVESGQHSAIMITLSDTSSTKHPARPLVDENKRVIYVTQDDMRSFCVNSGENVLVVEVESVEGSIQLVRSPLSLEPNFLAICKVEMISTPEKNLASLSSPIMTNSKWIKVPRILPIEVSNKLFSSDDKDSTETSTTRSDAIQFPSETPSKSNGNFTFENFLTSPTETAKANVKIATPQKISSSVKQIAILSLKHRPNLYKILTSNPKQVKFRVCPKYCEVVSSLKDISKGSSMLCHIVQGLCQGQFLSVGDIVTASFQGKKIQLELIDVEFSEDEGEPSEKIANLIQNMDDMTLNQKLCVVDSDNLMEALMGQLVELHGKKYLHFITFETKINIDFSHVQLNNDKQVKAMIVPSRNDSPKQLVAGVDEVLSEMRSILIPILHHPEHFPQVGPIRAPKGVLLHGSSGCGKSLLAIQLSTELKYRVKSGEKGREIRTTFIDCTTIQSATTVMGEAEKKLSKIFNDADKAAYVEGASTLIILDDIHLICPRRGMAGETSGIERVASTLLALMDGVSIRKSSEQKIPGNVIVVAITHNPSLLDPALRRAGRIDLEVEIPSPDDRAKCDIFRLCIQNMCKDDMCDSNISNFELMLLAKQAKGFTGADCALSVKEAMRIAIQRQDYQIHPKIQLVLQDLQTAVNQTKPSSIKSVTVEIPRVPWSSIGGMEDVKKLLREAIELPLTHSHLFSALKISPPRGVLLYGPPGCSKTLMARALATEGNMNFLAVKGPELLSKWLGESERALAALFRRARLASPCVIFFDELDAIAASRGSGEGAGGERLLSQLLTELDGVTMTGGIKFDSDAKSQPRVVVVGATNRPDLLDKALTRPGRIDRMIYVGLPDFHSRRDIFFLRLSGKTTADLDFDELAHTAEGFSGAEIVSICREASLLAIEESDRNQYKEIPTVKMEHVRRSLKTTKRQISKEMLRFYDDFVLKS